MFDVYNLTLEVNLERIVILLTAEFLEQLKISFNEMTTLIFEIIAAIGSLATFGAFLMLFRKDKDKQAQLDRLTSIASSLENQTDSLNHQNELLAQQVDIFRNTSLLKGNGKDEEALVKLQEIEEKRLKLSVKPNLWINGAGHRYTGELDIDLNNKGENAKLLEFKLKSDDIVLHSENLPYDLDKGGRRYIFGRSNGKKHIKDCEYEIDIIYADALDNKYCTTIKGKGARVKLEGTKEI